MRATRDLVGLSLLLATAAVAGAREELNAFTNGLKGLDGQFTQTVYDVNGKLKETSSGRVALSAQRLFRWEYVKPYEQLVIADGRKVRVYDQDRGQDTVRPQGAADPNSQQEMRTSPAPLDRPNNDHTTSTH